jgi:hypothetical protein
LAFTNRYIAASGAKGGTPRGKKLQLHPPNLGQLNLTYSTPMVGQFSMPLYRFVECVGLFGGFSPRWWYVHLLPKMFNKINAIQYSGGTGQKHWVHWRLQCPIFLRQTFVEWAAQTINKSYWAGEYYQQQRAKGSSYQAAVRALAFKWIRIVYRCWQTGVAYDESRYLKALERSGSPLLHRQARLES